MGDKENILPEDYHTQNGCYNCIHVFEHWEFDEGPFFYCTLNAPPRPYSGDKKLGEEFASDDDTANPSYPRSGWEVWREWSNGRRVLEFCICGKHSVRPPDPNIKENGHRHVWCDLWYKNAGCGQNCYELCSEKQRNACIKQQGEDRAKNEKTNSSGDKRT